MSIQFVSTVAYCGKIEQSISAPLRAGVREQCSAPLIKLNDIRDLFWLVNIIKPQAGDGKKLLCGRISQTITANNIEHRPPLTKMCGRCFGKFKWHRTDIRTKAAMATALAMKNLLRAPGKKKKMSLPGCVWTKGSHTLTCKLLLVSYQMIILTF